MYLLFDRGEFQCLKHALFLVWLEPQEKVSAIQPKALLYNYTSLTSIWPAYSLWVLQYF